MWFVRLAKAQTSLRIHRGYLQDAERMRTGQTARPPDKPHTERMSNVHPSDIFFSPTYRSRQAVP